MTLELHHHPLSSFSWKALIALYELGTPFEPVTVNMGDPAARAAHLAISPFGMIPALRDTTRGIDLFETSIIIEYVQQHYGGAARLIPADADVALEVRLMDRVFDLHLKAALRPIIDASMAHTAAPDPQALVAAHGKLRHGYAVLEARLAGRTWAASEAFSLADCAAAPTLFRSDLAEPLDAFPVTKAYRDRLLARPSVARVITEAQPFIHLLPLSAAERERLPS